MPDLKSAQFIQTIFIQILDYALNIHVANIKRISAQEISYISLYGNF